MLFQEKERVDLQEGGQGRARGDVRDGAMVLAAEPTEEMKDLLGLLHGLPKVA